MRRGEQRSDAGAPCCEGGSERLRRHRREAQHPPQRDRSARGEHSARRPRGVEPPPDDEAGEWAWYARHYRAAMLAGYGTRSMPGLHRAAWERLLSMESATVVCFCGSPDGCHRGLLAGYVARLGAVYAGER